MATVDEFDDVLRHLRQGDFSFLAPFFAAEPSRESPSRVARWHAAGRFDAHPDEAHEALTCAAFLGEDATLAALLRAGLNPLGGTLTGMTALHCAASRGHASTARLLLAHGAPLEARNRFGGTVLAQTVWSALHEPMPGQEAALVELLRAGADVAEVAQPTGDAAIDACLGAARAARNRESSSRP